VPKQRQAALARRLAAAQPMSTEHIPVLLLDRHALRVRLPKGSRIVATHGTLWLMRTGDRNDYLIRPGEHFVPGRASDVVVEALGGLAGFSIRAEAAPSLFQRPHLLRA